jgi:hypothetical protein
MHREGVLPLQEEVQEVHHIRQKAKNVKTLMVKNVHQKVQALCLHSLYIYAY